MVSRFFKAIIAFLRANFFAGLFVAVPFAITIVFLLWVWTKVQEPLVAIFKTASTQTEMPWSSILNAIQTSQLSGLFIPLISLTVVLIAILLLGIAARSIIGRVALISVEAVVEKVPVVGLLYTSMKQLGEAFRSTDGQSKFQRAVAVQFPYKGSWAIGFVTGKSANVLPIPKAAGSTAELLTVFVPTTPLPTAGFMIVVPEDETIPLEMPVQDALKLVISGGIISPGESQKHKAQLDLQRTFQENRLRDAQKIKLNPAPDGGSDR